MDTPGLLAGLGLVATTASGGLLWSLGHAPAWLAGLNVTQAVALGAVLVVLGSTFRPMRAYRERAARAKAVVRAYVPAPPRHRSSMPNAIDHRTRRLVRDDVRCVSRGDIRVKGFARALSVYEAAGGSPIRMP